VQKRREQRNVSAQGKRHAAVASGDQHFPENEGSPGTP